MQEEPGRECPERSAWRECPGLLRESRQPDRSLLCVGSSGGLRSLSLCDVFLLGSVSGAGALNAFLEALDALSKTLAKLRQFARSEDQQSNYKNDDEVCRCEQVIEHGQSPMIRHLSELAGKRTSPLFILSHRAPCRCMHALPGLFDGSGTHWAPWLDS